MINKNLTITLLLCFCVWQSSLFAQVEADALLETISAECCVCAEDNIKNTDSVSSAQLEMAIGLCLVQAFGKHEKELTAQGVSVTDPDTFNSYSEKIGAHLSQTCDHFLSIIFKLMSDENSNIRKEILDDLEFEDLPTPTISTSTGSIKKTEDAMFLRIWLQHNNGEDVFICLDELQNIEILNDVSSMIGKIVTVSYIPVQIYSPQEKKMIEMKKLISLKVAN
jgi:hypothetical protein